MSFYFLAYFIYAKNKEVEKMLHLDGRPWALKPYKDYKNQPEKYQEKAVGIRPKFGEFQQFQVHDVNFSQLRRPIYGFVYLQIFGCEIDLRAGDCVTVDKILYIQNKNKLTTIGCTIKEKSPFQSDYEVGNQEENGPTF